MRSSLMSPHDPYGTHPIYSPPGPKSGQGEEGLPRLDRRLSSSVASIVFSFLMSRHGVASSEEHSREDLHP